MLLQLKKKLFNIFLKEKNTLVLRLEIIPENLAPIFEFELLFSLFE